MAPRSCRSRARILSLAFQVGKSATSENTFQPFTGNLMTPGVVLGIGMVTRNLVVTMTKHPSLRSLKAAWNPILILPPVTMANFPEGEIAG